MIFDINNIPSIPDPKLDSNLEYKQLYTIADGSKLQLSLGDWVEILPECGFKNLHNTLLFQVINLYDFEVGILIFNKQINDYEETHLSTTYISNAYRHIIKE